jgi:hypothetical protein
VEQRAPHSFGESIFERERYHASEAEPTGADVFVQVLHAGDHVTVTGTVEQAAGGLVLRAELFGR